MTSIKRHINPDDFRRYRENRMNEKERNAFERQLEQDPFAAEAFEGYGQVSPDEFEAAIRELKVKFQTKNRSKRIQYGRVAAIALLLISSGIFVYLLQNTPETPIMVEQKMSVPKMLPTDSIQEEIFTDSNLKLEEQATRQIKNDKMPDQKSTGQPITPGDSTSKQKNLLESDIEVKDQNIPVAKAQQLKDKTIVLKDASSPVKDIQIRGASSSNEQSGKRAIFGQVLMSEDSLPIPGATILVKGTSNGAVTDENGFFMVQLDNPKDSLLVASFVGMKPYEFHPQSSTMNIARLEPDVLALDEVVTIGYGVSRKESVTGSISKVETINQDQPAQPAGGMKELRAYLDENALLPSDFPADNVAVRIRIFVNEQGEIVNFENRNNADEQLYQKARQLLLDGPEWKAAIQNNTASPSNLSLRIVFRKISPKD